jgi:hypothetical protein
MIRSTLTGMRFGRLIAKKVYEPSPLAQNERWECLCDCGKTAVVNRKCLMRGGTQSCGCLVIDRSRESNRKHGKYGTRVYRTWRGMLTRCTNPNVKDFCRYGGVGISVCKEWSSFENFYRDMGDPPTPKHTIDRKDGSKGYSKENCRWATVREQAQNRRSTMLVSANGKTKPACEWDRELGFFPGTVARRITKRGLSHEAAVSTPINKHLSRPQSSKHGGASS